MKNSLTQSADLFGSYPQMKKDETKEEIAERFKTPYDATLQDVKSVAEFTPIVGDAIALSELPENAQEAFNLLKGGFETRDVIRLGKGAGLATLAALDLTAVGDIAKPLIKKAKDALRGTADALSPQAVTDTGIPVDIPDTTTNVTQPITQEKPKPLEMQVRAMATTERSAGAIDKFKQLKRQNLYDKAKYTNITGPKNENIDYNYGVDNDLLLKELGDITNFKTVDDSAMIKHVEVKRFLVERAKKNILEFKRLTGFAAGPKIKNKEGRIVKVSAKDKDPSELIPFVDFVPSRFYANKDGNFGATEYENMRRDGFMTGFVQGGAGFDIPESEYYKYLEPSDIRDALERQRYFETGIYEGLDGILKTEIPTYDAKLKSGTIKGMDPANHPEDSIFHPKYDFKKDPAKAFEKMAVNKLGDDVGVRLSDVIDFPSLFNNERYGNVIRVARSEEDRRDFLDMQRDMFQIPYDRQLELQKKSMGKGTDEMPFSPNWVEYQPVQDIEIRVFDGEAGSGNFGYYDPVDDTININSRALKNPDNLRGIIFHELQHAIQHREGFDFGGNVREFLPYQYKKSDVKDIPKNIWNSAFSRYEKLRGEVEARITEKKDDMVDVDNLLSPNLSEEEIIKAGGDTIEEAIKKSDKTFPLDVKDVTGRGTRRSADTFPEITESAKKKFNEGGVTMKKQMNLFNEGGLEQDGGTVDPVSGNDVPVGSTQEEVRDDIPAQLSEGEFVFPADVVRFIGLEKLMAMRQKAKEGLKKMEAMGQMGNSEEATLPDDIPFDESDLIAEDDDGNEIELAKGGVLKAQEGTVVPKRITTGFAQEEFVDPKTGETVSVYNVNGMYIPFDPRKRGFVKKGTEVKPQEPVQQQQPVQQQPQQEDKDDRSEYDAGVEITLGYEVDPDTNKQIPQKYTVKKDLLTGEVLIANEKMDKEAGFSSPQWIQLDDELSQKLGFTAAEEGGATRDNLMMAASGLTKGSDADKKASAQAQIKTFDEIRYNENLSDIYGQHLKNQQQKKEDFKFSDIFKRKDKPEKEVVYDTSTVKQQVQPTATVVQQTIEEDKDQRPDGTPLDTLSGVQRPDTYKDLSDEDKKAVDDIEKGAGLFMNKGGIATKAKPKKKKNMKRGGLASKK